MAVAKKNIRDSESERVDESEYLGKLEEIQGYMLLGKFAETVAVIQQFIVKMDYDRPTVLSNNIDSEMLMLLNQLLVLAFLKLKEYRNALQISGECISKLQKSNMFGLQTNEEIIPFPLKYMSIVAFYQVDLKNKN
jgi:hypothetical protein